MPLYAPEEKYNKQLAGAYIAYMMLGSIFAKCNCRQTAVVGRTRLHYCEMGKNQLPAEEKVIAMVDNLDENFKNRLSDLQCDASFKKGIWKGKEVIDIRFDTGGFETVEAVVDNTGNVTIWRHEGKGGS